MSDRKDLLPTAQTNNGFTDLDLKRIEEYKEAGLPGIAEVSKEIQDRMLSLYMEGISFSEVSKLCRVNKEIVLFLAQKNQWFDVKQQYLEEIRRNQKDDAVEDKLLAREAMLSITRMYRRKLKRKADRYAVTGNEDIANEVDIKEVNTLVKLEETLNKEHQAKGPLIGINLPDGSTLTRKNDNQIEITPKEKDVTSMLERFKEEKRKEEQNRKEKK